MTMIDQVTQAIQARILQPGWHPRELARIAITAMREPTEAMMVCGSPYSWAGDNPPENEQMEHAKLGWQAMIDAALSEKPL